METKVIKIDAEKMDMEGIRFAADVLRKGGLVAFPTETVYGLGAKATEPKAVDKIFAAKGRPADNPLIVHVDDWSNLEGVCLPIASDYTGLLKKFWPGPLTVVLPRGAHIPGNVTCGLDTVAIRIPDHPVALALLREAHIPIAAPSANLSGRPSPTTAQHVMQDLWGRVDVILDAGSSKVGVESTVLDLSVSPAAILRPGGVTVESIKEFLPDVLSENWLQQQNNIREPKSPGMKYKHYSPKAKLYVFIGEDHLIAENIAEKALEALQDGNSTFILSTEESMHFFGRLERVGIRLVSMGKKSQPESIAANLFSVLRILDEEGADVAFMEGISPEGIGLAVMNRMKKASGGNIIRVGD